jgi:nucleoside-diphosphate-sugar epimerase
VTEFLRRGRRAAARPFLRWRGTYRVYPAREEFLRLLGQGGVGAELGVFRGELSRHILNIARPRELHLVDCWWLRYGDVYPNWGSYTTYGRLETRRAHADVLDVVDSHSGMARVFVHVGDAAEYLQGMPAAYFDWIYLDTSHEYEQSVAELAAMAASVKPEGLITGHDWQEHPSHRHHGLCRAVREFCRSQGWDVVHLDNHSQWAIQRRR